MLYSSSIHDEIHSPKKHGEEWMRLIVNGETCRLSGNCTLSDALHALDIEPDRVATLVNGRVVKKEQRAQTRLTEGDCVEAFAFAGGG